MKTTFIYALCEPGTRTVRYIGKADKPKKRLSNHLCSSINHKTHLGNWLRSLVSKGGKPTLIVLREVLHDRWAIAEERYIRLAKGCGMNLVNSTEGGEGMSNPTPETLVKMSGENNPMFGKTQSPEANAKRREASLGTRNHFYGKRHSQETLERMRTRIRTPEHCANIRSSKLGKRKGIKRPPRSPEWCAAISAGIKSRLQKVTAN